MKFRKNSILLVRWLFMGMPAFSFIFLEWLVDKNETLLYWLHEKLPKVEE